MASVNTADSSVLIPVVQPPDLLEHKEDIFFFQKESSLNRNSFAPPRPKKTSIPVNTVNPHPKFLTYFQRTEIGKRKDLGSLTPSELQQVSSNLPPDLQQELLNEDDGGENDEFRNSQKFKYEQCKQAAFSLLMRVAQNLESFDENEQKVPEDVEELMLETWEQLSANVVYEKRDWQTQAYKDEAMIAEREKGDLRVPSTDHVPPSSSESLARGAHGKHHHPKQKSQTTSDGSKSHKKAPSSTPKPPPEIEVPVFSRPDTTASEYRDILAPLPTAQALAKLKGAMKPGSRARGSSRGDISDDNSDTGSRKSRLSTRSGARSSVNWAEQSINSELFVTLAFSLESKEAEEKGWIVHSKEDTSDDDKRYTAVSVYRMLNSAAIAAREEADNMAKRGNVMPVQIDYWSNKKQSLRNRKKHKTVDMHGGDNRLLPWPFDPDVNFSQAYTSYISLPDGVQRVNYKNGQLAILFERQSPNSQGYYCLVFTEKGQLVALFVPGTRGAIYHPSTGLVSLSINPRGGTVYGPEGDKERNFVWPIFANKLLDPMLIRVNDSIAIKVLNFNQIFVLFSYHGEKHKINVTKTHGHGGNDLSEERSPYMLTNLKFISNTAKELEAPTKKRGKSARGVKAGDAGKDKTKMAGKGETKGEKWRREFELPGEKERTKFENDLLSLQVRVEYLLEEWLEYYRIHLGIPSPMLKNIPLQPIIRKRGLSARSTPAATLKILEDLITLRSHSAAVKVRYLPKQNLDALVTSKAGAPSVIKRIASVPPIKIHQSMSHGGSLASQEVSRVESSRDSRNQSRALGSARSARDTRRDLKKTPRGTSPGDKSKDLYLLCPVATRAQLSGSASPLDLKCSCSPYHPPELRDTELDFFLQQCVPDQQILIVVIVDSSSKQIIPGLEMFENIYCRMNRNRTSPCLQSKTDDIRFVIYNLATAGLKTSSPRAAGEGTDTVSAADLTAPVLQARHHIQRGMLMMFRGGEIYFADEIFNGYGVTRYDFYEQLEKTKRDIDKKDSLPNDFKFKGQIMKKKRMLTSAIRETSFKGVSVSFVDVPLDKLRVPGKEIAFTQSLTDEESNMESSATNVNSSPRSTGKASKGTRGSGKSNKKLQPPLNNLIQV